MSRTFKILTLLIAFVLLLAACATPTEEPAPVEVPPVEEEVVEEPVAEEVRRSSGPYYKMAGMISPLPKKVPCWTWYWLALRPARVKWT